MTYSDLSRYMSNDAHLTPGGTHSASRRARFFTVLAALVAFAALATVTAPHAAASISDAEELTRFGSFGEGAGQLRLPSGIATNPVTGHVYTIDRSNNRISEFTPWGNFVKAFGWDVAPGAVNEQQEVRVRASTGQFKLTFGGFPTGDLAFNAPGSVSEGPGSVEAALNALPSIGGGGANVSVSAVPGTADGIAPYVYVIAFKGSLAATNVAQITASNGTTALSGGVPSTTLEARTRADGTAGGTGLESCTAESGCKAGLEGAGAGEFSSAQDITADAVGNLYLREVAGGGNNRVQKFDPAGRFLLMFGGEVNETKTTEGKLEAERNRCTKAQLEGGDVCGIGTVGNGQGQFDYNGGNRSSGIAFGPTGKLFVGDFERIQRFNSEGEYEASVPVAGKIVQTLAIDPGSGDFYASVSGEQNIRKLDSTTGAEIGQLKANGAGDVAVDSAGNVFAVEGATERVLEYDSEGKPLTPPSCCEAEPFSIGGLGTNAAGTLYVSYFHTSFGLVDSFIRSFGPGPVSFEAAPKVPPSITAQFATSVERTGAILAADINPHFWSDTRYYVQYGTGKCSEGGCEETKPVPPGAILSSKVTDAPLQSAGIFLEGLKPGTIYHYRFVAQSSGGGPVRGVGGEVGIDGEESAFTTYPAPAPAKSDCPNQTFRTGFSAPLPDCRAFEMVSPVDKNNGDIKALLDLPSFSNALDQSSTDGDRFTYSSYRAFADPEAAPLTNQYFTARDPDSGWSSEAIDPAQRSRLTDYGLENLYKAFSADLCSGWLMVGAVPVLAPGATEGYTDLYRRDNCGGEGYEALIQVEPPSTGFWPMLEGTSADGKEAIFLSDEKLTEGAKNGTFETYYASKGELHLVCILPSGVSSGDDCSAGTGSGNQDFQDLERQSSVTHAISADGSRVYWTASAVASAKGPRPGKLYLRLNPGSEPTASGECDEAEPEKACTVKVSETASSKAVRFLDASADGSKALFEITEGAQAGNLYEFELGTGAGESTLISKGSRGVAGASEDLSYIYFVSNEASSQEIAEGAVKGGFNLYLTHEGTTSFVANGVSANPMPIFHTARATPDGRRLAFTSSESLTGYDNTDQATGEADGEVYLYEAGAAGPMCISCNPSGARPHGRRAPLNGVFEVSATAASIPPPQFILNSPRVLSDNGQRLFFDSYDALLPRDTNGKEDVYEWEAASGPKDCEEKGAELYVPSSQGCLSLISSGESPSDSQFLDASSDGSDAFITTNSSLLPQDPGLIDVYDAREGGGFLQPTQPAPCQGEACQTAPPPPNDPTPASASFKGAGDPSPKAHGRCAKGKVARKGRCVARKHKRAKRQHKRDAKHTRRAAR